MQPTTTTGVLFVGKDRAGQPSVSTHRNDAGQFVLKLRLLDNQGPHRLEPYVVRWTGPEAEAWWIEQATLPAGTALSLELANPRAFPGMRSPEIHADVVRCRLLPPRNAPAAPAAQVA